MLSKNSNRNNYREHCINQIPRTAVSEGWGGVFGGIEKNECCGLAAKKAENDSSKWRRGRGMSLEMLVKSIPILLTESTECFSLFECTDRRDMH